MSMTPAQMAAMAAAAAIQQRNINAQVRQNGRLGVGDSLNCDDARHCGGKDREMREAPCPPMRSLCNGPLLPIN